MNSFFSTVASVSSIRLYHETATPSASMNNSSRSRVFGYCAEQLNVQHLCQPVDLPRAKAD